MLSSWTILLQATYRTVVDNRCRYIYFDIEAQQETGIHVPNLLICQTDTGEEKRYRGVTCVAEFLDYLLEFEHNSTVIAHNFKGYDGFPVLKVLLDHLLVPDVIYAGGKLLSVTCKKDKICFVDSLNFLVMPLVAFPKAFDLRLDETSQRLSKGFFPFLFNTVANEHCGTATSSRDLPPRQLWRAEVVRFRNLVRTYGGRSQLRLRPAGRNGSLLQHGRYNIAPWL